MAEISLDFLMGPDWSSRRIAWWGLGKGGYSHCASVLQDGRYLDARDDKMWNADGSPVMPGIHIREPSSEAWVRRRSATLIVDDATYEEWEKNLRAKIGDKYAQGDILGMILGRMLHKSGTYDCSALAINALQHVKVVPFPLPFPAHEITPDAALLIVATAGFTIHEEEVADALHA